MDLQAISRAHRMGQTKPVRSASPDGPCESALTLFPAGSRLQAGCQRHVRGEDSQRRLEEAWARCVVFLHVSDSGPSAHLPLFCAEHLIIQRIDAKDETEDMESMLQVRDGSPR